jgi:hypothetical protein
MKAKKVFFFFFAIVMVILGNSSCTKDYDPLVDGKSPVPLSAKISITGSIAAGDSVQVGTLINCSGALSTGTIQSFRLDWGDGTPVVVTNVTTASQIAGSHSYQTIGQKLLKLEVYSGLNGSGEQAGASKIIHVVSNLPPGAALSFSGVSVVGDSALLNTNVVISGQNSTGTIKSYSMEYGDGTNSGIINVSSAAQISQLKTYNSIGVFSVKLTVYEGVNGTGAQSFMVKHLSVINQLPNLIPIITFSSANMSGDTVMVNTNVVISGASSTGIIGSFGMNYGDGTFLATTNVSSNAGITANKVYTAIGTYTVKLTVYSGYGGTGSYASISRNLVVVNIPPVNNQLLIKYDSLYQGAGIWKNSWKLNLSLAFGQGYSNDCYYKGDANGWGMTSLSAPIAGWVYFETVGSQRFTIINKLANGTENWAKLTTNVNLNEQSLTKWNSWGCVEVESKVSATYPIFDPGSIGDQLININKLPNGNLRINIKSSPGTFVVTPGVAPALRIQYPSGWVISALTAHPNDPFGHYYYLDVVPSSFNGGMVNIQILPNINQPSSYFYWGGSYWAPNSTNSTYSISSVINPPWKSKK